MSIAENIWRSSASFTRIFNASKARRNSLGEIPPLPSESNRSKACWSSTSKTKRKFLFSRSNFPGKPFNCLDVKVRPLPDWNLSKRKVSLRSFSMQINLLETFTYFWYVSMREDLSFSVRRNESLFEISVNRKKWMHEIIVWNSFEERKTNNTEREPTAFLNYFEFSARLVGWNFSSNSMCFEKHDFFQFVLCFYRNSQGENVTTG